MTKHIKAHMTLFKRVVKQHLNKSNAAFSYFVLQLAGEQSKQAAKQYSTDIEGMFGVIYLGVFLYHSVKSCQDVPPSLRSLEQR